MSARGRRPLHELPLELYTLPAPPPSLKRPVSPGAHLLSPRKRLILESPTATKSPARKLDFGTPKASKITTPFKSTLELKEGKTTSQPSRHKLAPSPEIKHNAPSKEPMLDDLDRDVEYFSKRLASLASQPASYTQHYPGFDVHYQPTLPPTLYPPTDNEASDVDNDVSKENLRPVRRPKKHVFGSTLKGASDSRFVPGWPSIAESKEDDSSFFSTPRFPASPLRRKPKPQIEADEEASVATHLFSGRI
ncbi:hypothetical protein SISNIDRAFT_449477 [Sistotremastrum niveocremeum HHB9708]|uniref:Uncharacterized protein n=1 Tax=Sistotremastrum niveocremeum HHB9708 TaxID=1314777 RepID=A0A164ZNE4_9AGAM|nr:hypothetical protein SISNIDRAFT_449477 [Sistotremastrum niveocremeum HHB9708]